MIKQKRTQTSVIKSALKSEFPHENSSFIKFKRAFKSKGS